MASTWPRSSRRLSRQKSQPEKFAFASGADANLCRAKVAAHTRSSVPANAEKGITMRKTLSEFGKTSPTQLVPTAEKISFKKQQEIGSAAPIAHMNTERKNGWRRMGTIKCCKNCPKKQVGCKPTCIDYILEKAFHEVEKAEQYEKMMVQRRLDDQMFRGIAKYRKYAEKG